MNIRQLGVQIYLSSGLLFLTAIASQNVIAGEVKEIYIGRLTDAIIPETIMMNADMSRIVYVEKNAKGSRVMANGKPAKPSRYYDGISGLAFSDDGRHLAYFVHYGLPSMKAAIVVDGKTKVTMPDPGIPWAFRISPNGKRYAYGEAYVPEGRLEQGQFRMVIDGKIGKGYEFLGPAVFSPDSRRVAYAARKAKNKVVIVLDGKESPVYEAAGEPTFSPDSKRFAYWAVSSNERFVVVDGQRGKGHEGAGGIRFSPDSRRVAYLAGDNGEQYVVIDGKRASKGYDEFGEGGLVFSPDGKRMAFRASLRKQPIIVVDGNEIKNPSHDKYGDPVFSPDSRRVAYVAVTSSGKAVAVVDGKESRRNYDLILMGRLAFVAPNKLRYFAIKGMDIYQIEETL